MKINLKKIRFDYDNPPFRSSKLPQNPLVLFEEWFAFAVEKKIVEPNAMALATVNKNFHPSVRYVLIKDIKRGAKGGIYFCTNYDSRKGIEIKQNNLVACTMYWQKLSRQVRIEGRVELATEEESDYYFNLRPSGARISAWASNQSKPIKSYQILRDKTSYYKELFKNKEIPRPKNWGAYKINPISFEFWQGQKDRLHDRILYKKINNKWSKVRLAP